MADVRALLKAKRQDVKISHPLASYSSTGQLRCAACGIAVKHASAWEGHLGSKVHRTNVARLKEEEQRREVQRKRAEEEAARQSFASREAQASQGKRKAEDEDMEEDESEESDTKRRKVGDARPSGFPADFFSDPNRIMPKSYEDSDEEGTQNTTNAPVPAPASKSEIDLEYERFQRELQIEPHRHETFERATVFAEPVMVETTEGLPKGEEHEGTTAEQEEMDEEAKRQKKEQEERELIMDRLLDEESQQEEADMRVTALKAKVEALKKKREAKRTKPAA